MNEYPDGGAVRADVAEPLSSVPAALPPNLPAEQSLLSAIVHVARDPQLDVAKLEALMRMQFEVEKRQAEKEFIEAFARLSSRLPRIKKEGGIDLGGKGKIAFARIEDMDKVIRPLLTAEGFTLSFDSSPKEGGGLVVSGHLMHSAGHSRTATIPLPLDVGPGRNSLQAVGSTLQYGKRYLTEMLLNLVREGADDDGIKGAMRFATEEEVAELQALIQDTGTDEAKFCNLFNIAHLGEMPFSSVTPAKNMLFAKKGKKQ